MELPGRTNRADQLELINQLSNIVKTGIKYKDNKREDKMVNTYHSVHVLLEWMGVTNANHRTAIIADLAPGNRGIGHLTHEDEDGIADTCTHYNRRNPPSTRFHVSRTVVRSIQNLLLYVKDQARIGITIGVLDSVAENEFLTDLIDARERQERREQMEKNGKALITTEFYAKLKNRNQWERWSTELKSTLDGIIGMVGIPLSYVIRENHAPNINGHTDWDQLANAATPLTGAKYTQDSRMVHQIILRNIAEDSDAYTYIKPNINKSNGRVDYEALCVRYDSHASRETRINEAKKTIQTLQYRNERSMPFERFVDKFQRAVDDLETGGRPMHNDDIIDALWPKLLNNEIKEFVMALKVDQARNPRNYRDILQDIAAEIPKISPASTFKRNVAEVATTHKASFTKEGSCPNTGVMSNGKIFIGNYTGNKWYDESVKPYHQQIKDARVKDKNNTTSGSNNYKPKYQKSVNKALRKLKKLKAKVEKLNENKRKLQATTTVSNASADDSDRSSDDEANDQAGTAFGGRQSVSRKKRRRS